VELFCSEEAEEGVSTIDAYGSLYYPNPWFRPTDYNWILDGEIVESGTIDDELTFTYLSGDYFLEPGLYDIELQVTKTFCGWEWVMDSERCTSFVAPATDVLFLESISDETVTISGCYGWGGITWIEVEISNILPRDMPLLKDELTIDGLPDGAEILYVCGPDIIEGNGTATLYVKVYIPAGTPEGDYEFTVDMPYLITPKWHMIDDDCTWWCGDDDTGTYDDYWFEPLFFFDVDIATENTSIKLDHYIQSEGSYDGGVLLVTDDDGATWYIVPPVDDYDYSDISGLGTPGFSSYDGYAAEDFFPLGFWFEGQTVDMAFVFGSDYSIHSYDGWYINSVEVGELVCDITPPVWTVLDGGDEYGDSWTYDEVGEQAVLLYGGIDIEQFEFLVSPALDFTDAVNPELTFYYEMTLWSYDTDPNYVAVSVDGIDFYVYWNISYPDPDSGTVTIDLSDFEGEETVYIAFIYWSTWGENWYVDDVVVSDDSGVIFEDDFSTNTLDYTIICTLDLAQDITCLGYNGELTGTLTVEHYHWHHHCGCWWGH
jgi:hypothetical protein